MHLFAVILLFLGAGLSPLTRNIKNNEVALLVIILTVVATMTGGLLLGFSASRIVRPSELSEPKIEIVVVNGDTISCDTTYYYTPKVR